MGKGNVCTLGKYEGLYYIDNDDIHVYRRDDPTDEEPETCLMRELDYEELTGDQWLLDEYGTMEEQEDIEEAFVDAFTKMFPSFSRPNSDQWLNQTRRVLLENGLFYICLEDDEWSVAVELIQKEEPWGDAWMENLQKRWYERYLDGIKRCLLDRLPSICIYTGAWTSRVVRKEDL